MLLYTKSMPLCCEAMPATLALPKTGFEYKQITRQPIRVTVWSSIVLHVLFAVWFYGQRVEPAKFVLPGNINFVLEAAPEPAVNKAVKLQARPVVRKKKPVKKTVTARPKIPSPVSKVLPRKQIVVKQSDQVTPVSLPVSPPVPEVVTQAEASPVYLPPQVINEIDNPKPHYPGAARRRGMQGTVLLLVQVSEKGKVDKVKVRKSSGFRLLDNAATEAVKLWQFAPGRKGVLAMAGEVIVPVKFNLISETL